MEVTIKKISELAQGKTASMQLLVEKIEELTSKKGKKYKSLSLFDGSTHFKASMWESPEANSIQNGNFIIAIVEATPYNGQISYLLKNCRQALEEDGIKKEDFIPTSPLDPEAIFEDLMITAEQFSSEKLTELVSSIYNDNKAKILHSAAASCVHHNIIGGLLYHTYRMVQTGQGIVDTYPMLNRDLLIAGIMLHDIGKLIEMETDEQGITKYTIEGNMLGHLLSGAHMIMEYGKKLEVDEETILNLCHIIASHHGKPEWGAIVKPATAEAAIVHHIDMIDSRIYQFEEAYKNIEPGNMSESRYFGLDNIFVYRPNVEV